jgi:hypothetical protein
VVEELKSNRKARIKKQLESEIKKSDLKGRHANRGFAELAL